MRKLSALVALTVLFAVLYTVPASAQTGGGDPGPVLCGVIHTPRTDEPPCTEPPPQSNGVIHTPRTDEPDSTIETLLDTASIMLNIIGL